MLHHVDPGVPCHTKGEIKSNISKIMMPGRYVNGMSCSLFSCIIINDMKYKLNDVQGSYKQNWEEGDDGILPKGEDVCFVKRRNIVSVKMADILFFKAKSHIGEKKSREDVTISLAPVHAPIKVNFWHFNLFLEVRKVSDNSVVECKPDRTKRLATALNDDFMNIIHPASKSQKRYLEKSIYRVRRG